MNEIKWTSSPKIATVMGRLAGGADSGKLGGHQPAPTATYASPVKTYSTAKIVEKTRRNGDISGERKVVNASIRPTAPMLSSVGSAATPRTSIPPVVMPANQAIAATIATPMLNGFMTGHSPRRRADDMGSKLGHIIVTGCCGPNGRGSSRLAERREHCRHGHPRPPALSRVFRQTECLPRTPNTSSVMLDQARRVNGR